MSSLLISTKKRSIPTKRKDPVASLTKIERKNAAYGLDEPTDENLAFVRYIWKLFWNSICKIGVIKAQCAELLIVFFI